MLNERKTRRDWLRGAALSLLGIGGASVFARSPERRRLVLGGAKFSPAKYSPLIWLTPDPAFCFTDDGVTRAGNGDSIKQWNNRGSLGGFFTQATAGLRPTMVLVGGKWFVRSTSGS